MKRFRKFRKAVKKKVRRQIYRIRTVFFGKKRCSKDTKRCPFHSTCCTENLRTILTYINSLFNEAGITYWLDYGTLLGAVRDGDLIEYDTDLDIGILYRDREKFLQLKEKIEKDGFHLKKDHSMDFYRICLSATNTLHADVFFWKKNSEGMMYREQYLKKDDNKGRDFPEKHILQLKTRMIKDAAYPVPDEPEKFCEFRFGKNWNERIRYND